jgi:hypothetical protein
MGNAVNIVQEHVGEQLPQVESRPDENGDKTQVELNFIAGHHLEEVNSAHDDHQFFDGRGQPISE